LADEEVGGYGEDLGEVLYGSEGYYVEGGRGQGFSAGVLYIDVGQCKGAGYFAQEGGFLLVGFDQGESDVGGPEFYGDAGEAGAGAEVGDSGFWLPASGFGGVKGRVKSFYHRGHGGHGVNLGEEMSCGEEALAEVSGYYFFFVADCG
jgi:hypothetical protein